MTYNCLKLGRAVTFIKYLAGVVSLIFLPKILICNKIMFPVSNSLNFAVVAENVLFFFFFLALQENELLNSISK